MIDKTLPMRRAKRHASRRWRPKLDTNTMVVKSGFVTMTFEQDAEWCARAWGKYCPDGDVDKLGQPDWEGSSDD